jgi:hypothetical protein
MKPVLFFSYKKQVWCKRAISVVAITLILFGCYFVYSITYSTWLLYQCQKYSLNLGQKNLVSGVLDANRKMKQGIIAYLSLKKKYEKRLKYAYRFFDWCITISNTLKDTAILEQLTIGKTEISCSITTPNMQVMYAITEQLLQQPYVAQVMIQSYQKSSDGSIQASLFIIPKKGR